MAALVGVRALIGAACWPVQPPAGVVGLVAQGACVIVLLYALFLTVWLSTLRVEVWPGRLDLVRLLRGHRYPLVRGQITRVHPARRERGRLLGPMIGLGIQLGPARLSGRERLTVIRLASTPTVLIFPARAGRLAIAPADEEGLVAALVDATQPTAV